MEPVPGHRLKSVRGAFLTFVARSLPPEFLTPLRGVSEVRLYEESGRPIPRSRLLEEIAGADAVLTLLTERVDAEFFDAAPNLRIVANMAVGYDNIDLREAENRGVTVTNTPDVLTEATADLAFALLLATARRLVEAAVDLRAGRWQTWSPLAWAGVDVHGATLGIVGLGRIGEAVARRARGFSMRVLYHNRSRREAAERSVGVRYRSLDGLLRESDFVLLLLPLSAQTRSMIGRRELSLMKPDACLINAGRGAVVDEAALREALESGRLFGAGLDVFSREPLPPDHPLLSARGVTALPHIGSASRAARKGMAELAAANIAAVLSGRPPLTPVRLS